VARVARVANPEETLSEAGGAAASTPPTRTPTRTRTALTRRCLAACTRARLQGQYVQLSFATSPKTLTWLQHDLRTDERVVRWLLVKKPALPPLPKLKEIKRLEAELCVPPPFLPGREGRLSGRQHAPTRNR
jgi:hypothetical protein